MKDDKQKREDEIFKQKLQEQKDRQDYRDFLKDRSIGGANSPHPRPSEELFDKDMTRQEMTAKATQQTERQMAQEERQKIHAEKHRQGMIDHQKRLAERGMMRPQEGDKPKPKLSEQTKKIEFKRGPKR